MIQEENKHIYMFKDGRWVDWNGQDVSKLLITERMTFSDMEKRFPDMAKKYKSRKDQL